MRRRSRKIPEIKTAPRRIVVNYRPGDTSGDARAVYDALASRYGADNVFLDVVSRRPVADWLEEIDTRQSGSTVFITLIGPRWHELLAAHEPEQPIDAREDVVRLEIENALESAPGVSVIPVLIDDAIMPQPDRLPRSLTALATIQCTRLRHTQWEDDLRQLIEQIEAAPASGHHPAFAEKSLAGPPLSAERDSSDGQSRAVHLGELARGENVSEGSNDRAGDGSRRRRALLARARPYLKSIVLLSFALATTIVAIILYPTDSSVAAEGKIRSISLDLRYVPFYVAVTILDNHANNGVTITARIVSQARENGNSDLAIAVPASTWGGPDGCWRAKACFTNGNAKLARWGVPKKVATVFGGNAPLYARDVTAVIPDVGTNDASNKEYAEVLLPDVQVYQTTGKNGFSHLNVPTTVAFSIDHADRFSWTSGITPIVNDPILSWSFPTGMSGSSAVSGIALGVQDTNARLIFVVGVLLGIGGAALVGAIQEAIKTI